MSVPFSRTARRPEQQRLRGPRWRHREIDGQHWASAGWPCLGEWRGASPGGRWRGSRWVAQGRGSTAPLRCFSLAGPQHPGTFRKAGLDWVRSIVCVEANWGCRQEGRGGAGVWTEPCPGLPAGDLSDSTRTPGPWLGPRVRKGQAGRRAQAGLGQAALTDTEADRREAGPGSTSPYEALTHPACCAGPSARGRDPGRRAAAHRRGQAGGSGWSSHLSTVNTEKVPHTPGKHCDKINILTCNQV